jgi:hypothetical protein
VTGMIEFAMRYPGWTFLIVAVCTGALVDIVKRATRR